MKELVITYVGGGCAFRLNKKKERFFNDFFG